MSNLADAQKQAGVAAGTPTAPERPFVATLRRIDRGLARLEEVALTLCLATLILLGVYQAFSRKFTPPSPFWIDEMIRYSVFFIGLGGAALAAQANNLFNIDMLTRWFGHRGRLVLRVVTALFAAWVCWRFFSGGLWLRHMILDETGEVLSPATGILALPIATALVATHLLLHAVIDVVYLVTGDRSPDLADLGSGS